MKYRLMKVYFSTNSNLSKTIVSSLFSGLFGFEVKMYKPSLPTKTLLGIYIPPSKYWSAKKSLIRSIDPFNNHRPKFT